MIKLDASQVPLVNFYSLLTAASASKDAEAFARSVKDLILNSEEDIKKASQPADTIRVIVQTLSELDVCPTGNYLSIYQDIHKNASELLAQAEKGKPADLQSKLSEIVRLAKSLPGEVTVQKDISKD